MSSANDPKFLSHWNVFPSVSKKENINKSKPSNKIASEKTVQRQPPSHHKHKREMNLSSYNSKQKVKNESMGNPKDFIKIPTIPSRSIYTYEKKKFQANYIDYDPQEDVSEGYDPDFPELFASEKLQTTKKVGGSNEQKSSQKHKLKSDEQTESVSKSKKFKSDNHSNSHLVSTDELKKLQKEKEKQNSQKDKDPKIHLSSTKKKSNDKTKSDGADAKRHKMASNSMRSEGKEYNENCKTKCNKSKQNLKLNCSEEFTSSEVRFEDCLSFNDIVTLKKKKTAKLGNKKTTSKVNKKASINKSSSPTQEIKILKDFKYSFKDKLDINVPKLSAKLDVLDIVSTLPEMQPNTQPLPPKCLDFYSIRKKAVLTDEDAIRFISSRREKTAVYSGKKSYLTEVPTLFECCTRVLIENIDAIGHIGGIPYLLLSPVLKRCTPNQLFAIENYNPDLLDDTNELWKIHCRRDYKLLTPEENETWRDLYLRAHDEYEQKLKSIKANISASMSKSNPVRKVKLAFVDSIAKPPRNVARQQAKNNTAGPVNHAVKGGPSPKSTFTSTSTPAATSKLTPVLNATSKLTPTQPDAQAQAVSLASNNFAPKKPKVAPLMAKTLKSMKQCFRR